MQSNKPYSKSLKKFINKTNPQQKQLHNYLQKSQSTNKILTMNQPSFYNLQQSSKNAFFPKLRTRSQKIHTQPTLQNIDNSTQYSNLNQVQKYKLQFARDHKISFQQNVDNIICDLVEKGQAEIIEKYTKNKKIENKKLKNLRIVTQQNQKKLKLTNKKKLANEHTLSLKQSQKQQKKIPQFNYNNPHIQKKVVTRWQIPQGKGVISKQLLSYYPLSDFRKENQQFLLNGPGKTQQYLRRIRQVSIKKFKPI